MGILGMWGYEGVVSFSLCLLFSTFVLHPSLYPLKYDPLLSRINSSCLLVIV